MIAITHPAKRYWLPRLYVAVRVLAVVLFTLCDPTSANRSAVEGGGLGWFAVAALGALALLAVLDVVVNDLAPDRCSLPSTYRHRHLLHMGLALGILSMGIVLLRNGGSGFVLAMYCIDAAAALCVALLDVFARHHVDRRRGDRRGSDPTSERRVGDRRSNERRGLA